MGYLRLVPALPFLAALTVFLILSNVRWIALDPGTYEQGFVKYQISASTGMRSDELEDAARQLIRYFDRGEPITLQVRKENGPAPLFNERETAHLSDVRDLFQLTFRVQEIAGAYIVAHLLLYFARQRSRNLRYLGKLLAAGGAATVSLFIFLFALTTLNFDDVFLGFHLISFRNDFWMLDPRTDYLVRMFPQGFWFDVVREVVLRSLIAAVALVLAGLSILRVAPKAMEGSSLPARAGGVTADRQTPA